MTIGTPMNAPAIPHTGDDQKGECQRGEDRTGERERRNDDGGAKIDRRAARDRSSCPYL
jgi:hypothetical protein